MVTPCSLNRSHMRKKTSLVTFPTPASGLSIQIRRSNSTPLSPKALIQHTGAGSVSTRG